MRLTIVIENVKDKTKKIKRAMFVTLVDKKQTIHAASELPKDCTMSDEIESMITQMKDLKKKEDAENKKTKSKKK